MEDLVSSPLASPRRMLKSDSTTKLDTALIAAQKCYKPLLKTHLNPHFNSKYADLADLLEAIGEALATHGLLIPQSVELYEGKLSVKTELIHVESGEFRGSFIEAVVPQEPPKVGIAITYFRRYAISTLAGIASEEDTDGSAPPSKTANPPKAPTPTTKPAVNQTPAQPKEVARPGEPKLGEPVPADTQSAAQKDRDRTKEDKTAHNARIRELQKAADPDKIKEYVIVNCGPDYTKASFETWEKVLGELEKAKEAGTLAKLVGA